jgi:mgtE-like transporter
MFKENTVSCLFDLGGLVAGFAIAFQLGIFQTAPWAIALYPAIVSVKGVTTGLISGRLSTALHLGTVNPKFLGNTQSFYKIIGAIVVLTLVTSATISGIAMLFGTLFWGITSADFAAILTVMVATMFLGLLTTLITTKVMFISFKKSLDPELIVFPAISTTADIIITLIFIGVLSTFFLGGINQWIILTFGLVNLFLALLIIAKYLRHPDFRKIIKESILTMLLVSFIVNITGTILKQINSLSVTSKEIFITYPAVIDLIGDVGLIVGSAATTKLALGELTPSFSSIRKHSKNIISAWFTSILFFTVLGTSALILNNNLTYSGILNLFPILLITNIIAFVTIVIISYAISIVMFKRGLDPDNFVIPIISTLADAITTAAILASLFLTA